MYSEQTGLGSGRFPRRLQEPDIIRVSEAACQA